MNKGFSSLNISEELVTILTQNRITEPTPIQHQAIPVLLAGKDVIAQAQTGTGKTLAFLLPIMQKINTSENYVQALIITPTRELALQITQVAKMLAAASGANILAAYGGQDVELQRRRLKNSIHIVIGTPGRLLDHLNRKSVNFTKIKTLVLDEADQMLDMGFLRDVEQIIHHAARHRQTLLCSATMPKAIAALAERYLTSPSHINVAGNSVTLDKIRQLAVETTDDKKQDALCAMIDEYKPFMAIIFCRTKRRAHSLNRDLKERGYASDELHGDLTQGKREKAMKSFRESKTQYLVATDVAARGLDIDGITHIFNYDMPRNAEGYIHRIGRTGRAGQEGFAITFVSRGDRAALALIERGIKTTIETIQAKTGSSISSAPHHESVPGKIPSNRYAAQRPYSSNSSDGRSDRGSRKFSGERRPFARKGPDRNESPHKKGFSSERKSPDRNTGERNFSGNAKPSAHYKYGDRRPLPSKSNSGERKDGRKPFSRESDTRRPFPSKFNSGGRKPDNRNSDSRGSEGRGFSSGPKPGRAKPAEHRTWSGDSGPSRNDTRKKPYAATGKPRSSGGNFSNDRNKRDRKPPFEKDGNFRKFSK